MKNEPLSIPPGTKFKFCGAEVNVVATTHVGIHFHHPHLGRCGRTWGFMTPLEYADCRKAAVVTRKPTPGTLKSKIYHFIKHRSPRGFTMWEVAKCLGAKPCSVSARMNELHKAGLLKTQTDRTACGGVIYFTLKV